MFVDLVSDNILLELNTCLFYLKKNRDFSFFCFLVLSSIKQVKCQC